MESYENSLKENSDSLSYVEDKLEQGGYAFGDLRSEVDDVVALTVLGTALYVDDVDQEIGVPEDAFGFAVENESARRGISDRPLGLETLAVAGGAAGTVGSAWRFLEEGSLEYLVTGALSAMIGSSAFKRIGRVVNARGANNAACKKLDKVSHFEDYNLRVLSEDEVNKRLEQSLGNELDADVKAYTAEELEGMSEEELMEEFEN